MNTVLHPSITAQQKLLERPQNARNDVDKAVREIIKEVRERGDDALVAYAAKFDNATLTSLKVTAAEIAAAAAQVTPELKTAIQTAYNNIYTFHSACFTVDYPVVETMPGMTCWRKSLPIQKVGLYIPGGSAQLFSTVLMLAIPAKIAGNKQVVLCSPTDESGNINPIVLYTANLCGVTEIYKTGGAQAIAAMTYGTQTIPAVHKIFGPGNAYVTRAKELAQQAGVSIDMPAGPSEVLIIADATANPAFVAADLLAQAEHGADSQVILLTDSVDLSKAVNQQLSVQLSSLSRKQTAEKALENSTTIVLENIEQCISWSDYYAPEHLIINTVNADEVAQRIEVAGSIFIGAYTCESLGDYASGTNHTLPTYGYARNYSGVSVDSFVNKVTYQKATAQGILNLGPAVEIMAAAEGLDAHKNAVSVRLNEIAANPKSLPPEGTFTTVQKTTLGNSDSHTANPKSLPVEGTLLDGLEKEENGREKHSYETASKSIYGVMKSRAVEMRKQPTVSENLLWQELRNKKLGAKFRRQHIMDGYIVDFVSIENRLIIEVEGKIHLKQIEQDTTRQEALELKGYAFLRFTNEQVERSMEQVLLKIQNFLVARNKK